MKMPDCGTLTVQPSPPWKKKTGMRMRIVIGILPNRAVFKVSLQQNGQKLAQGSSKPNIDAM